LEPPPRHPVGECTSSVATAVICFLSSGGWPNSLVMQDQMDVSQLSRGVMLPVGATPLHPITGWPSLLPSSSSRTSIGSPCGSLSPAGDVRGYHVPSQSHTNGLGALCPPVACTAHDKERGSPCTRYSALLAQACQHLWLVFFDDVYRAFTWVRHTIHPSPVSVSVLTDTSSPHGCDASLATVGSLSEGSVRVVTFPHIFVGYR